MNNDPYTAPSASLDNSATAPTIPTSIWTAKGRLSVLSFWGHSFLLVLVFGVAAIVLTFIGTSISDSFNPENVTDIMNVDFSNPILLALAAVAIVLYLIVLYITICMTIKRLHDRNHSGWWCLAMFIGIVIPFVNLLIIFAFLYVYFWKGNPSGNRFGGRRETKLWEKILGIMYLVIMLVTIGGAIVSIVLGVTA